MTPGEVYDKYIALEKEASAVMVGADPEVIIAILAEEIAMDKDEVAAIVLRFTANRTGG